LGEGSWHAWVSPRWFPRRAAGRSRPLAWMAAPGEFEAFPPGARAARQRMSRARWQLPGPVDSAWASAEPQVGPRSGRIFAAVGERVEPKAAGAFVEAGQQAGRRPAFVEVEERAEEQSASANAAEQAETLVSAKTGEQAEARLAFGLLEERAGRRPASAQSGVMAQRPGPVRSAWARPTALRCLAWRDVQPVAERGRAPAGRREQAASHALSFLAAKATRTSRRLALA